MKYPLSFFLVLLFSTINGQNYIDILSISYTNTPSNNFENITGETNIEELDIQLNFPVVINKNLTVLTGLNANRTQLKVDSNLPNSTLNSIGLNIGINQIYTTKWSGTHILLPKIASDLNKITKQDFQIGLVSLFTYSKRENLKYKYGLYANSEKYGPFVVPLIGLYYLSPNQKFESNIMLPIKFDFNYKLFKKAVLGINFDGLSTTYHLNNPLYSSKSEYVAKNSNEIFTYLKFKLGTSIYLKTKIGYSVTRSYEVFDSNDKIKLGLSAIYFGDDRTQLNQNFETGAIFKVELLYRFHFKK